LDLECTKTNKLTSRLEGLNLFKGRKMSKKQFLGLALILVLLACCQSLLISSTFTAYAAEPSKLKIYVGPTSVLADKGDYEILLVQLQDSKNVPARALEDTTISLSSSQTNVGTVDSSITIPKSSTEATGTFHSTYTPGTTKITAVLTGYMAVEASVTTVGPMPSTLAVYGFPPVLPADGGSYDALIVQLQDSSGSPAKAPLGSVEVSLSSTNNTVAAVPASVTIEAGNTYATATIQTTAAATGSAVVTAIASGYSSKQTTITTKQTATQANTLKIYVAPPKVLAEGKSYNQILVQLQNASGFIAQIPTSLSVTLSSSKTDVGAVDPTITIPASKTYATAKFTSTYFSGTTTIIAAAPDYATDTAPLTTVGPVPKKLSVYCLPSALPADNQEYKAIQVQLQDSQGKPAKDPEGDVTVNLFSSEPEAGTVETTLTIPFGETYATGTFTSTATANTTTITAQTSGYESGQAKVTTYSIDKFILNVTVTADPDTVNSGQQTTIRAHVTYNGTFPTLKAIVTFKSNLNGSVFSSVTEEGNGYYATSFTPPSAKNNTICTITANATKTGYVSGITTLQVTINPSSTHTSTLQLQAIEENGNPISNAKVTMQSQANPEQVISGVTDETGYVTLEDILEGSYTIQVSRDGYETKNETITIPAGQSLFQAITLSQTSFLSLPVIIAIIIVVAVVVLLIVWFILKRRKSLEEETEEAAEEEETEQKQQESTEQTKQENAEQSKQEEKSTETGESPKNSSDSPNSTTQAK
jgi:hypothetical protein